MSAMIKYYSSFTKGIRAFPCGMYMRQTVGFVVPEALTRPNDFYKRVLSYFHECDCSFSAGAGNGLSHGFAVMLAMSDAWKPKAQIFRADPSDPSYGCCVAFTVPSYYEKHDRREMRTEFLVRSCAFLVICSTLPLQRECAHALRVAEDINVNTLVKVF